MSKINTGVLSLPTYDVRPPGQTQPIYDIVCRTVQDWKAIVATYSNVVIEWTFGDSYPFLWWTNGSKWRKRPMTAELPVTLLQEGLIRPCLVTEVVSKWEPVR